MKDGDKIKIVHRKGTYSQTHPDENLRGTDFEQVIKGTVRKFEQDGETRWELITNDPQYPAVGFLPETVIVKE